MPAGRMNSTTRPLPVAAIITSPDLHMIRPTPAPLPHQQQQQPHQQLQQEWITRFPIVLQRIAYAVSDTDRLDALQEFRLFLSLSTDTIGGHIALDHGADRLLAWQLTSHIQNRPWLLLPGDRGERYILASLLASLELLWTSSSRPRALTSILTLMDLTPWLTYLWRSVMGLTSSHDVVESDDNQRNKSSSSTTTTTNNTASQHDATLLLSIVSIFNIWTRLSSKAPGEIRDRLLRTNSGLLDCLLTDLRQWANKDDNHHQNNYHTTPRRVALCRLVKELTFRADHAEKEFLYEQLHDIIWIYCYETTCMEAMSAVLWNFSCAEQVGSRMTQTKQAWEALRYLWNHSVQSPTSHTAIRRNVSSAIGTMVAQQTALPCQPATSSIVLLLQEQSWLLALLLDVLENHKDADLRRRCMRTVRCLASCEWGRTFLLKYVPSFRDFMSILIETLRSNVDDVDTRIQVCYAISALLPRVAADHDPDTSLLLVGPYLETTLVQTIEDVQSRPKLVLAVTHTLTAVLQCSPWQRGSSCYSKTFLERMLSTLQEEIQQPDYHLGISSFLIELVGNKSVRNVKSSLVCISVVEILTLLLNANGSEFESSKQAAITIALELIQDQQSRKIFVQHDALLTALVNFCLMANGTIKDDAKQIILALVPEL